MKAPAFSGGQWAQLIGDGAPLPRRHRGIVLHRGGGDEGGDDTRVIFPGVRERIPREVHPGAVK